MNKEVRIMLTGGGTGGHLYPLLAIGTEIKSLAKQEGLNIKMRYLGSGNPYEELVTGQGIEVSKIVGFKLRRYFSLANVLELPKFVISLIQSLAKVFWFMPDVIFSKGGPGALAVILAGRFYRIPVIIHESDAVPSLTTKISAFFAERIAVSFASAIEYLSAKNREKTALVGNPIRPELLNGADDQNVAKLSFGFNVLKPLILILGGSQGSTRINEFALDNFKELIKVFQVLHQTGENNFKEVTNEFKIAARDASEEEKNAYKIVPYLGTNLKSALAAADLVFSRAGAGAIFEAAAFGKPTVLIPYPEAASSHQKINAYEYARSGAAVIIEEENLLPHVFVNTVKKLVENKELIRKMSEAAKRFSKVEAAKTIAGEIINLTTGN